MTVDIRRDIIGLAPPRPDPRNNWPIRIMVYFMIQNIFISVLKRKLNIVLFFRIDWERFAEQLLDLCLLFGNSL